MRTATAAAMMIAALPAIGLGNAAGAATCSTRMLDGTWAFTTQEPGKPADGTAICLVRFNVSGWINGSACFSAVDTTRSAVARLSGSIALTRACTGGGTIRERNHAAKVTAVIDPETRVLSVRGLRPGRPIVFNKEL